MRIETELTPHPHGLPDDFWIARLINQHDVVVIEAGVLEKDEAQEKLKAALRGNIEHLHGLIQFYEDAVAWMETQSAGSNVE